MSIRNVQVFGYTRNTPRRPGLIQGVLRREEKG